MIAHTSPDIPFDLLDQTAFEVSDSRLCVKSYMMRPFLMTLKDMSSLPPRKRHQISGAGFLATSRSVCSSIRQSVLAPPAHAAMRLDQSVAVLTGAPPNAELSGLAL